jgi:hypothetical protein
MASISRWLSSSKSRSGRRPISVGKLLEKDKKGTLFKKHGSDDEGLTKKERLLLGSAAIGTAPLVLPEALDRTVGIKRFYHGTGKSEADAILQQGLDPSLGGRKTHREALGDLADVVNVPKDLQGHAFVSDKKFVAQRYADKAKGRVLEGAMPREVFNQQFVPDRKELFAFRTPHKIEASAFHTSPGDLLRSRLRSPGKILSYARNNPGSFISGVGLATLPALGLSTALHGKSRAAVPIEDKHASVTHDFEYADGSLEGITGSPAPLKRGRLEPKPRDEVELNPTPKVEERGAIRSTAIVGELASPEGFDDVGKTAMTPQQIQQIENELNDAEADATFAAYDHPEVKEQTSRSWRRGLGGGLIGATGGGLIGSRFGVVPHGAVLGGAAGFIGGVASNKRPFNEAFDAARDKELELRGLPTEAEFLHKKFSAALETLGELSRSWEVPTVEGPSTGGSRQGSGGLSETPSPERAAVSDARGPFHLSLGEVGQQAGQDDGDTKLSSPQSWKGKLAEVGREDAERALNHLETLEFSRPTPAQLTHGALVGSVAAPLAANVSKLVAHGHLSTPREVAGQVAGGLITGTAVPLARSSLDAHLDRKVLRDYVGQHGGRLAERIQDKLEPV